MNLKIFGYNRCGDAACECCYRAPHTDICQIKGSTEVNSLSSTKVSVPVTDWKHWMSDKQSPRKSCGGIAIAGSDEDKSYGIKTIINLSSEVSDILFEFEWIDIIKSKAFFQIYVNSNLIRYDYFYSQQSRGTSCAGIQPHQKHRALLTYHSPFKTNKYEIMIKYYSDQAGIQVLNLYTRETCKSDANGCLAPIKNAASNKGRTTYCSQGQGINDSNGNCQACTTPNCKFCRNYNYCDGCDNNMYIKKVGSTNSQCTTSDCQSDSNYFAHELTKMCVPKTECSLQNCLLDSCTGISCKKCKGDMMFYGGKCIDTCPGSLFRKGDTCVSCEAEDCKTCGTDYQTCETCNEGYYELSGSCRKCIGRAIYAWNDCRSLRQTSSSSSSKKKGTNVGFILAMVAGPAIAIVIIVVVVIKVKMDKKKGSSSIDVSNNSSQIGNKDQDSQNAIIQAKNQQWNREYQLDSLRREQPKIDLHHDKIQTKAAIQEGEVVNNYTPNTDNTVNQGQPVQINVFMDPNIGMNQQYQQYQQDPYGVNAYQYNQTMQGQQYYQQGYQ